MHDPEPQLTATRIASEFTVRVLVLPTKLTAYMRECRVRLRERSREQESARKVSRHFRAYRECRGSSRDGGKI